MLLSEKFLFDVRKNITVFRIFYVDGDHEKIIAIYEINAIIELNISYKISINYCSINTQIVIILRTNFKYSTVVSTFSEHNITIFQTLSIDI